MKRRAALMMVVALVVVSHIEYAAADVTLGIPESDYLGPVWDIDGIVSRKDLLAVENIARQPRSKTRHITPLTFRLNSHGGDIQVAIAIGRQIRKMSAGTLVAMTGRCYSACVFVFAAGIKRDMFGELGIHRPYSTQTGERAFDTVQQEHRTIATLAKVYLQEMNVLPALYDAMVAVPPSKIRILSDSELTAFGLSKTDPVYQEIEDASEANSYSLSMSLYQSRKGQVDTSCSHFLGQTNRPNDNDYYNCKEAIMYGLSIPEFVRRTARATEVCRKEFPPSRKDSEEEMAKFRRCRSEIIEGSRK